MGTIGAKRGETARRIYAVLKREPDLTVAEINDRLPTMTYAAVACAVSKMKKNGAVEVRGYKDLNNPGRGRKRAFTYHVKYKTGVVPPKQSKPKPKTEAPKAQAKPTWSVTDIKPEPEGPKTPKAEREVLVLRHLTDIYKAMTLMTDQQDALIAILKDTLLQLDAAERELERERQRRNWWDKVKGLFA